MGMLFRRDSPHNAHLNTSGTCVQVASFRRLLARRRRHILDRCLPAGLTPTCRSRAGRRGVASEGVWTRGGARIL